MSLITMKNIAVMSVNYCHYSLDYFIDSMKKCGIENIDFWGGVPHYCRLDYKDSSSAEKKVKSIRDKFADNGMRVVIYTPETLNYPYSISSPETAVRKRTIDYFKLAMEDAINLGTDKIFINTGCGLLDLPKEESWQRAVESVNRICAIAETYGITMVIEQLQPYESNLLTTLPDLVRMLNEVDSKALKACVDVVAMAVTGEQLQEYIDSIKNSIELIHLADGDPSGHYVLGDGNLPLMEYINALEGMDYSKIITLEINDSIYWADPHDSIKRSVEFLNSQFAALS